MGSTSWEGWLEPSLPSLNQWEEIDMVHLKRSLLSGTATTHVGEFTTSRVPRWRIHAQLSGIVLGLIFKAIPQQANCPKSGLQNVLKRHLSQFTQTSALGG